MFADETVDRPEFVSTQVTEAERYYLHLDPNRSTSMVVVCGGCERLRKDYVVSRKTFPYFCVEFVADGAGTLELHGKCYPLRPGMAFAYAPKIAHLIRNDPRRPMRKYYVDFVGKEAARLLLDSPLGHWQPVRISAPQEVLDIFAALQRDAFAEGDIRDQLCAAQLRLLLLKIGQKSLSVRGRQPRAFATYQRARHYISTHFTTLKKAEDVARACHMTPVHLSRLFRRFGNCTPYDFLMRLKMNRAAELLSDSDRMVKEVADQLHFPCPFQFSRTFKRVYGLSPGHFIHRNRRSGAGR